MKYILKVELNNNEVYLQSHSKGIYLCTKNRNQAGTFTTKTHAANTVKAIASDTEALISLANLLDPNADTSKELDLTFDILEALPN